MGHVKPKQNSDAEEPQSAAPIKGADAPSPKFLADLSGSAWAMWHFLCQEPVEPTKKEIGDAIGRTDNTVTSASDALEAAGLIEVDRNGSKNRYKVLRRMDDFIAAPTKAALGPTRTPSRRTWVAADGDQCRSWLEIVADNYLDRLGVPHWCEVPLAKLVPKEEGKHTVDRVAFPYAIEVAGFRDDDYEARLELKAKALRSRGFRVLLLRNERDIYDLFDSKFVAEVKAFILNVWSKPERRAVLLGLGMSPTNLNRVDRIIKDFREEAKHELSEEAVRRGDEHIEVVKRSELHPSRVELVRTVDDALRALGRAVGDLRGLQKRLRCGGHAALQPSEAREAQAALSELVRAVETIDGEGLLHMDTSPLAGRRRSWTEEMLERHAEHVAESRRQLAEDRRENDEAAELAYATGQAARKVIKEAKKLLADKATVKAITPSGVNVLKQHLKGLDDALGRLC